MRTFSTDASRPAKELLVRLLHEPQPAIYRETMRALGRALGDVVVARVGHPDSTLLVCTNEDADFLGRGLFERLEEHARGVHARGVKLACFWNARVKTSDFDVAPIERRYVEEDGHDIDAMVVVKSIISSSCVVRTLITELVGQFKPRRIVVASPVLLKGAEDRLRSEFPRDVSDRFEYVWFATDDESKPNGEVIPGIGGSVYELLGLGDGDAKNRFTPELVRDRRRQLHAANAPKAAPH